MRTRDRQALFNEACGIAVEAGRFPFAWVGVVEKNPKLIRVIARAREAGYPGDIRELHPLDANESQAGGPSAQAVLEKKAMIVNDVQGDPRFGREAAESTGYVPKRLMAVPLLNEDEPLGVLSVLDRSDDVRFTLAEMELLGRFANQAAIGLELLLRARRAQEALEGTGELAALARVAGHLDRLPEERRDAGLRLLAELDAVLRA